MALSDIGIVYDNLHHLLVKRGIYCFIQNICPSPFLSSVVSCHLTYNAGLTLWVVLSQLRPLVGVQKRKHYSPKGIFALVKEANTHWMCKV